MAYWQGELKPGERRTNEYRCEYCEHHGLHRDRQARQCLKHYSAAHIPVAKQTREGFHLDAEHGEREVGVQEALDELARLHLWAPERTYMELADLLCLCPTALLTDEDWKLVELEGAVREYGAAYFQAYGYGEHPPARVLDALAVVRATRNEIDARKWRE